ncbi:hypothetical protein HUJ04_001845 [Dendroctonus ponderosae]|nr:hypothetical protein HUJ04_001845 [Dendroctonus ponderosae]
MFPSIFHLPISHVFPHSILSQTQGELVDRIEYQVETTQNHVAEGHQQLKTAQEYQSKARKKKIFIIICLIILLIVLIAILASTLSP